MTNELKAAQRDAERYRYWRNKYSEKFGDADLTPENFDRVTDAQMLMASTNKSKSALTQPAATGQAVGVARISLNGFQLRAALEFAAPDGDDEQLESEVTIQYGPARTDDDGTEAAGMFCWISDYPEEGSIRLDDCPSPAQTEAV